MTTAQKGLEFDPGFAPYILAFSGTLDYLYADINRFKNFSQKKLKFRQYYKKILDIFNNNLGFYIGCLLWACYIKSQPEQEILNNHCFGKVYDEKANVEETELVIKFVQLFPKDIKYFLNEMYEFPPKTLEILNLYKEFLIINKGFVDTKTSTDLKLPENIKIENAENYKQIIDSVLKEEDLSKLIGYKDLICQE